MDEATVVFNNHELRRVDIFQELNIETGVFATQCFTALDSARINRECALGSQERRNRDNNERWTT